MTTHEALEIMRNNQKEKGTKMIKVINIYGKRIVVDQIHSYFMDEGNDEVIVVCDDQAYNFQYSKKLMGVLDSLFDVYNPDLTISRNEYS